MSPQCASLLRYWTFLTSFKGEKWDSLTRSWYCNFVYLQAVTHDHLLGTTTIIFSRRSSSSWLTRCVSYPAMRCNVNCDNKVHILNESRGSTLEVVVSRMKARSPKVRFILVSATVPNINDIADWIGNPTVGNSASALVYEVRMLAFPLLSFPNNRVNSSETSTVLANLLATSTGFLGKTRTTFSSLGHSISKFTIFCSNTVSTSRCSSFAPHEKVDTL